MENKYIDGMFLNYCFCILQLRFNVIGTTCYDEYLSVLTSPLQLEFIMFHKLKIEVIKALRRKQEGCIWSSLVPLICTTSIMLQMYRSNGKNLIHMKMNIKFDKFKNGSVYSPLHISVVLMTLLVQSINCIGKFICLIASLSAFTCL